MVENTIERVLSSSNLILFFSLPFRPVGKRNVFYNGHIALGLEGMVYQVYNPKCNVRASPFLHRHVGRTSAESHGPVGRVRFSKHILNLKQSHSNTKINFVPLPHCMDIFL
jgi:hypothetical protein